jgi:hypothetical protein
MAHCGCAPPNKMTEQRMEDLKKAQALAELIRYSGDLSIKDRTYRLRTYKNCFIASDLVDCLIRMREASSRQEAVKVGLLLVSTDYIHHVVDEHHFEDGYLFFRFRQDDRPGLAIEGPSAVFLQGQEGSVANVLHKRRALTGWVQYYFVLSPVKRVLYQFRTELDSSPLSCWSMKGVKVQPALPRAVGGKYLLQFIFPESSQKDLVLGADSSDIQLAWLRTLDDLGMEVLPSTNEEEEQIQNATSIFEFQAKTIDGERVSLEKYRGHVTLIVNVASQ